MSDDQQPNGTPLIDQAMEKILQRIIKPAPRRHDGELADAYLKLAQAKQLSASKVASPDQEAP